MIGIFPNQDHHPCIPGIEINRLTDIAVKATDVKPGLLESVVLREARREMPVSLDEMYLSWKGASNKLSHL